MPKPTTEGKTMAHVARARSGRRIRIAASRAATTQRAVNAGLPLDRADLTSSTTKRRSAFRRDLAPAPSITARRRVTGEVTNVDRAAGTITVHLFDQWGVDTSGDWQLPLAILMPSHGVAIVPGEKIECVVADADGPNGSVQTMLRVQPVGEVPPPAEVPPGEAEMSEMAAALNAGELRREIDEALGWDPELSV